MLLILLTVSHNNNRIVEKRVSNKFILCFFIKSPVELETSVSHENFTATILQLCRVLTQKLQRAATITSAQKALSCFSWSSRSNTSTRAVAALVTKKFSICARATYEWLTNFDWRSVKELNCYRIVVVIYYCSWLKKFECRPFYFLFLRTRMSTFKGIINC